MQLSLMTFMYEIPMLVEGNWNEQKSSSMEKLLAMAKEAGFEGVDLIYGTVREMTVERIRGLLRKLGLKLNSLICFERLGDAALSDEEALKPYLESVRMAKSLNCPHLMLTPGFTGLDPDTEKIRGAMIRRFRIIKEEADKEGILCMIEDDPDLKAGMCRAEDVASMLRAVPGLNLVYDSANMIVAGEDPVTFYESLHEYVIHMHIKDIMVCDDPAMYRDEGLNGVFYTSAPHGKGMVDFESLFRSFDRHGYKGVLSLEFVPLQKGEVSLEELTFIYRKFAALSGRYSLGVNEVPLLSKLIPGPEEEVWEKTRESGISGVEICILPEDSERVRAHEKVVSEKYKNPRRFAQGEEIISYVERIRAKGLEVNSCHLMLCEAYPELLEDNVPYLKKISEKTGIRQFVISCSFESALITSRFLPHMQKAAKALKESGITLCYHNHHQDGLKLENGKTAMEMVLEECPDVMLQLDIGWAWYAHMDSLSFMKQYGNRIVSVHLKDLAEDARERTDPGRFTAIGKGAVPTKEVLENLDLVRIAPGKLIIDQDASSGDMYEDLAFGASFVKG